MSKIITHNRIADSFAAATSRALYHGREARWLDVILRESRRADFPVKSASPAAIACEALVYDGR
jgi:hypothetical protein